MHPLTAAHVTHEACEKIGGIGSVLEGFLTSPVYQREVRRSILVGPYPHYLGLSPQQRLGPEGRVLYSSVDGIDEGGFAGRFHPIEWAFNVAITYGTRRFTLPGSEDHTGTAEILLIDVFKINHEHVNQFKARLAEIFGIDSRRYEDDWGYEEYVRLAEPAFYALLALLDDAELPCILFSHEFMGLPTAFKCALDGQTQFRTVFHAHECGTARAIVESHPGHDTAFYNILRQAREKKLYVNDVFGDRAHAFRHALISQAHLCDAIIAVGDYTAQEMHFLGPHFDHHQIDLVYNGIPHLKIDFPAERRSREMLLQYSERLLGWRPDVLMTHVTRPVISKGIWRDLLVCDEMERAFAAAPPPAAHDGRRGALFILASAGGTRRPHDVLTMEDEYGWPRHHREGYPDLVGPEIDLHRMIEHWNARHERIQAVLVNQFGWSRELIGQRVPAGMDFGDFRRATDIEFGMATYEPFGISPLEPLAAGALCVISSVCGCRGFVEAAARVGQASVPARDERAQRPAPLHENVIVADFTRLDRERSIDELLRMTRAERDAIEAGVAKDVGRALLKRLPASDVDRRRLLDSGQRLVRRLGWDHVLEERLLPMLHRVVNEPPQPGPVRRSAAARLETVRR